jgi:hypothetical protein
LGDVDDDHHCHFELNAETMERAINLFDLVTVKSAGLTIHSRNEKTTELLPFIKHYIKDPLAIYHVNLPPKKLFEKIAKTFEIIRMFPSLDKLSISSLGFAGLAQMRRFDQLHF